jgi:UDP:flavonoid glycosyltransferase YjiC (YdhE family)
MKVLFVVVDGGGNLPPQFGVASALRVRGVDVHFLAPESVRKRVEAQGFPFEPLTVGTRYDPERQRSLPRQMADFARLTMDREIGPFVLATARRFRVDAVVVDVILTTAVADLAASEFPTVVFVHCFYRAIQNLAAGPMGMLLRLRGIAPLGAEGNGALQLVSALGELDPVRGAPPVRHTGVVWQGTPRPTARADVPKVLVSLSTNAIAGQRRMLQNILDALAPLPLEATVTVGPAIDAHGLRVPPNATMHAWLDHDEVLAGASLLVGHGGHSTAMRAISFGVPTIVMPANVLLDQKSVGAALQKRGAGVLLPKHSSVKRIRAAIERVLSDSSYADAAGHIGAQIRERDGAEVAADLIGELAASRVPRRFSAG